MTTLDHAGHALRRKGYAPHYVAPNLALFYPQACEYTMGLLVVWHSTFFDTARQFFGRLFNPLKETGQSTALLSSAILWWTCSSGRRMAIVKKH